MIILNSLLKKRDFNTIKLYNNKEAMILDGLPENYSMKTNNINNIFSLYSILIPVNMDYDDEDLMRGFYTFKRLFENEISYQNEIIVSDLLSKYDIVMEKFEHENKKLYVKELQRIEIIKTLKIFQVNVFDVYTEYSDEKLNRYERIFKKLPFYSEIFYNQSASYNLEHPTGDIFESLNLLTNLIKTDYIKLWIGLLPLTIGSFSLLIKDLGRKYHLNYDSDEGEFSVIFSDNQKYILEDFKKGLYIHAPNSATYGVITNQTKYSIYTIGDEIDNICIYSELNREFKMIFPEYSEGKIAVFRYSKLQFELPSVSALENKDVVELESIIRNQVIKYVIFENSLDFDFTKYYKFSEDSKEGELLNRLVRELTEFYMLSLSEKQRIRDIEIADLKFRYYIEIYELTNALSGYMDLTEIRKEILRDVSNDVLRDIAVSIKIEDLDIMLDVEDINKGRNKSKKYNLSNKIFNRLIPEELECLKYDIRYLECRFDFEDGNLEYRKYKNVLAELFVNVFKNELKEPKFKKNIHKFYHIFHGIIMMPLLVDLNNVSKEYLYILKDKILEYKDIIEDMTFQDCKISLDNIEFIKEMLDFIDWAESNNSLKNEIFKYIGENFKIEENDSANMKKYTFSNGLTLDSKLLLAYIISNMEAKDCIIINSEVLGKVTIRKFHNYLTIEYVENNKKNTIRFEISENSIYKTNTRVKGVKNLTLEELNKEIDESFGWY